MPRKKQNIKVPQLKSYSSIIYGALTVVVIFLVLFFGIKAIQQRNASITPEAEQTSAQKEYVVKEGDTLWSIAEKTYNDGFKWPEIAKENKIVDPSNIEKGTKLILPELAPTAEITPTVSEENIPIQEKITTQEYIVVKGDNLWDICVRAYGDGYKWVEIAKANNLQNPDLIHPGNKLELPR